MSHVWLAVRLALAGVFVTSAVVKLRGFGDAVAMSGQLLGHLRLRRWARVATGALIATELGTGTALLFGPAARVPALVAAAALLAGVTVVALLSAGRAIDLRCACFGRATHRLGWRHVWRNLVLLSLSVGGLYGALRQAPAPVQWDPAGVAVAIGAAAVVTVLVVFYDDIADIITDADRATG